MAITTTPLGFKKPDGNELARNGDNAIADNAQTSQDLISNARSRLAVVEAAAFTGSIAPLIEDPEDPGFYITYTEE